MNNAIDLFSEELKVNGWLSEIKEFFDCIDSAKSFPKKKLKNAEAAFKHLVILYYKDVYNDLKSTLVNNKFNKVSSKKDKEAFDNLIKLCQAELDMTEKNGTGCSDADRGSGTI